MQKIVVIILAMCSLNLTGQELPFIKHNIDLDFNGIHSIKVIDFDQDGDYDIVGGSEHTPYTTSIGLAWWRNDGGYPITWTRTFIDQEFLHIMSVDVAFIDNDTLLDVVCSSWESGKVSWWKNPGTLTNNWERFDLVTWTYAHDAYCYDFNFDNKNDILAVSSGNNRISIFYNVNMETNTWDEEIITSTFYSAKHAVVADMNNDSLPDIIAAADGSDAIVWWENLGQNENNWDQHYITTGFQGSCRVDVVDLNFDNQLDIIGTAWESHEVSIWICDNIQGNDWSKTLVTNNLFYAAKGQGIDYDLDNDIDIVATGYGSGEVNIYENSNFVFTNHTLQSDFEGTQTLKVFDIDSDGDEDIIAGAGIDGDLLLFENTILTNISQKASIKND